MHWRYKTVFLLQKINGPIASTTVDCLLLGNIEQEERSIPGAHSLNYLRSTPSLPPLQLFQPCKLPHLDRGSIIAASAHSPDRFPHNLVALSLQFSLLLRSLGRSSASRQRDCCSCLLIGEMVQFFKCDRSLLYLSGFTVYIALKDFVFRYWYYVSFKLEVFLFMYWCLKS